VTTEEVLLAGANARCCLESNLSETVGPCVRCGSKKKTLVTIRASSRAVFGPHELRDVGVLKYCFNLCRSQCTSSRDHLRSRIVLVVDGIRGLTLRSSPLVLRSREKLSSKAAAASPSAAVASPPPASGIAALQTASAQQPLTPSPTTLQPSPPSPPAVAATPLFGLQPRQLPGVVTTAAVATSSSPPPPSTATSTLTAAAALAASNEPGRISLNPVKFAVPNPCVPVHSLKPTAQDPATLPPLGRLLMAIDAVNRELPLPLPLPQPQGQQLQPPAPTTSPLPLPPVGCLLPPISSLMATLSE